MSLELGVVLRDHSDFSNVGLDAGGFHRFQHRLVNRGVGQDFPTVTIVLQVVAPASRTMFIRSSSLAAALEMIMSPFLWNIQATEPASPMLPPFFEKACRSSLTVRLRLSVDTSTRIATPPGP